MLFHREWADGNQDKFENIIWNEKNSPWRSHVECRERDQGKFVSIMALPENSSSRHTLKELMEITNINLPADEENSISCELLGEAY